MAEPWTRKQIRELGLVAMQAGIESPEQLQQVIARGVVAEWRVPLALGALVAAQHALRGLD